MSRIKSKDTGISSNRNVYLCRGRLVLHGIGELKYKDRMAIVAWLQALAFDVQSNGKNYSKRFTARYLV